MRPRISPQSGGDDAFGQLSVERHTDTFVVRVAGEHLFDHLDRRQPAQSQSASNEVTGGCRDRREMFVAELMATRLTSPGIRRLRNKGLWARNIKCGGTSSTKAMVGGEDRRRSRSTGKGNRYENL